MNIAQLVQQCAITDQPLTIEEVARVRIYLQTIDDLCLEHIERALATARKNWTHAREEADRYKAAEGVEIAVLNRIKRASPQPTDNRQAALLQRCVLEELQTRYAMFDDALSEQIDEYYSAIIALEKLRHVYVTLYPEAQLSPRTARAELEASPTRRRCLLPPSLTIATCTLSSLPSSAAIMKSRSSPSLLPRSGTRGSVVGGVANNSANLFQSPRRSPHRSATKS